MAEAKAEAQESSSPRCLLLLAGSLQAACQAVSAERFCLLGLANRFPTEHVSEGENSTHIIKHPKKTCQQIQTVQG